ncbi:MAG: hypothetical protein JRF33_18485 [Deltaproteobacteria bacterium]|nr:hypothetical protein [Deltaproteobacteria bacterium]
MSSEPLLSNRKASQIFFSLLRKRMRLAGLAKLLELDKEEVGKLLERMERVGMVLRDRGIFEVDWERFASVFVRNAMAIYSTAMPWKYMPYYLEREPDDFIEAACARGERELAKIKVKLADNDLFRGIVKQYFLTLAKEVSAPEDYFEDLRVMDAVDEFEYGLLKLEPLLRRHARKDADAKELNKILRDWTKQVQAYDTPTGEALRTAFERNLLTE